MHFQSYTLAATLLAALPASAAPKVLLTYFDPFGGAKENQSQPIAESFARELPKAIPSAEVALCRLPVVYDAGARTALRCLADFEAREGRSPDLMLSFGEAACQIQLETQAENWDATDLADNAGVLRRGSKILPDADAWIPLGLPADALYERLATPAERAHAFVSRSAGNFVCNNTAFLLEHALQARAFRYGFIHVPAHFCAQAEKDPNYNGELIARMIAGIL